MITNYTLPNIDDHYIIHNDKKIPDIEKMTATLLLNDILYIGSSENNKYSTLYVNCNDYFVPSADGETLTTSEIPILFNLIKEKGYDGVYQFVANKRNIPNLHWRDRIVK